MIDHFHGLHGYRFGADNAAVFAVDREHGFLRTAIQIHDDDGAVTVHIFQQGSEDVAVGGFDAGFGTQLFQQQFQELGVGKELHGPPDSQIHDTSFAVILGKAQNVAGIKIPAKNL